MKSLSLTLPAIKAGAAYFAAVFACAFVLGVIRVLLVAPHVGATVAVLLETPIVLTISWIACGRIGRDLDLRGRAVMGATAFVLLMGVESAMSILLFGQTAASWIGAFASPPGAIGLAAQLAFAVFPLAPGRSA
jgi:hypothetical protein